MRGALFTGYTHAATPVLLAMLAMPLMNGCYGKQGKPQAPLGAATSAVSTKSNGPLQEPTSATQVINPHVEADSPEAAGHYLVLAGGCNDCHTPNWAESKGRLPESEWLTGKSVGFRGRWGTTYPMNLRIAAQELSEGAWVRKFRHQDFKPPMPGQNWVNMAESDLVAIYRFIRALGPAGRPAPEVLLPGQEPMTPYILLVPQRPRM